MPDRVIREKILTSDAVNCLSWAAEVFYRRLMSVADDYGRYDGRPSVLRAFLYPLKLDAVSLSDVVKWVDECSNAGLVRSYTVDGREYLELPKFNQRLRAKKSKYPPPLASADIRMRVTTSADIRNGRESESESETEAELSPPPTFHPDEICLIETLAADCLEDRIYFVEHICRQHRITPEEVRSRLKQFNDHLRSIGETKKTSKDYRKHFQNWLKKQSKPEQSLNTENAKLKEAIQRAKGR